MRAAVILLTAMLSSLSAEATEHATWKDFQKANRYKCPGPLDTIAKKQTFTFAGKKYTHTGYRMEVQARDDDKVVKIGVISAIKDVSRGTRANLAKALEWYKAEKVEWLVVNGDLALEEFDLEEVFDLLGESGLPVIMVVGNSESRGSWARAYKDRISKYPNLINGVWVRQIVADDVEFWTLPGYHDKAFVRQGAGCLYEKEHTDAMLRDIKAEGSAPIVLVGHGPPKGKGKYGLDYILDKKNVGDSMINRVIEKANIPFGLFGHILEAGGRGVDADMTTRISEGKSVPKLYVNAGSLSGDPWGMLDGRTGWGMAMLFTIDGTNAKFQMKQYSQTE